MKKSSKQIDLRAKELRKKTLELAISNYGSHFGGFFSSIDIMSALYDDVLQEQDQFILSKGHACFPWYVLLREKGYNPSIKAHPDKDVANGILYTTGSLGHGLPLGVGAAMAKKLQKNPGKIYILMGDGECQEGTTYESILLASPNNKLNRKQSFCLDNLVTIIDCNRIQGSGMVNEILSIKKPLMNFAKSNGWIVSEIDGHKYDKIISVLQKKVNAPHLIIANTIKGKGVSFMEDKPEWHSKIPTKNQIKQAYEELT